MGLKTKRMILVSIIYALMYFAIIEKMEGAENILSFVVIAIGSLSFIIMLLPRSKLKEMITEEGVSSGDLKNNLMRALIAIEIAVFAYMGWYWLSIACMVNLAMSIIMADIRKEVLLDREKTNPSNIKQ